MAQTKNNQIQKQKQFKRKRSHQSQHQQQNQFQGKYKFRRTGQQRCVSIQESHCLNIQTGQNQKQYNNLQRKLAQKQKLKIGTRNFSKTFYSKLAKKIVQKPLSFFKFGLKEQEKLSCKNVFSQLFKIQPQKLKGTISISQLWDNKSTMKYLKQNQMFFNKDILLKQFQTIDKQQKLKKRQFQIQKQREFVRKYRQMVRENQNINKNNQSYQQMRGMDSKEACSYIRFQIDKLSDLNSHYRSKTKSRKIIDKLQKNHDNYDKIADKFKNRMIVLL